MRQELSLTTPRPTITPPCRLTAISSSMILAALLSGRLGLLALRWQKWKKTAASLFTIPFGLQVPCKRLWLAASLILHVMWEPAPAGPEYWERGLVLFLPMAIISY